MSAVGMESDPSERRPGRLGVPGSFREERSRPRKNSDFLGEHSTSPPRASSPDIRYQAGMVAWGDGGNRNVFEKHHSARRAAPETEKDSPWRVSDKPGRRGFADDGGARNSRQ